MEKNLDTLCSWSPPREVSTRRGPRILRTAAPTESLWAAWRADKPALKAAGIGIGKNDRTGQWQATWWQEIDTATQVARAEAVEASAAVAAEIDIPCPEGLAYLPFQRAGIAYAAARPNTLIADEMGLGKTIQALGVINATPSIRRALVVCPASLKSNWAREAARWLVEPWQITVVNGKGWAVPVEADRRQLLIVNYDLLKKYRDLIRAREWDLLVIDEAHFAKNPKAQRTRELLGDKDTPGIPARRKLLLTGTPIVNRPIELWTLAHAVAPERFPSFFSYAKRYCGAEQKRFGWDFSGATNLDELQRKLRETAMVRRLKKDVLTELPPKRRQIVTLDLDGVTRVVAAENKAWSAQQGRIETLRVRAELAKATSDEDYRAAVEALRQATGAAFAEIAALRHDTAVAKLPAVIEHCRGLLEDEEIGKLVIFCHHHDCLDGLVAGLAAFGPVHLDGRDSLADRQAAVGRFQSDDTCRVFIGSLAAAGVGITLTAASTCVVAELPWTPAELSQAEDRLHRIGQAGSVLVQHLVLDGSLDAQMAATLVAKQEILDAALDDELAAVPVIPTREQPTTVTLTREAVAKAAPSITLERIMAVHQCLRILADDDTDGAALKNEAGYNRLDSRIGHELAQHATLTPGQAVLGARIVAKYRRQLPEALYTVATGGAVAT